MTALGIEPEDVVQGRMLEASLASFLTGAEQLGQGGGMLLCFPPDKEIIGKMPRCPPGPACTTNNLLKGTFTALALQAQLLNADSLLQRFQATLIMPA
ncbi:hypothetical protein AAFF_G00438260 [Aldrovandia affinis]|uniref:Uncharacterized protein n=1 Tax=Aldrovandia affinis TaxID=143900 RepID=A0AAD7S7S8_9TELE|nr:hypothetical protein AAFF_G00438260 [Aldrovandia affinis]